MRADRRASSVSEWRHHKCVISKQLHCSRQLLTAAEPRLNEIALAAQKGHQRLAKTARTGRFARQLAVVDQQIDEIDIFHVCQTDPVGFQQARVIRLTRSSTKNLSSGRMFVSII